MTTSARTVRHKLAHFVRSYVPHVTDETVYAYPPETLEAMTPGAFIKTVRRRRTREVSAGTGAIFYLELHFVTLYSDEDVEWNEEDAEDQIDDMEAAFAEAIDNHPDSDAWLSIDYSGDTVEDVMMIEGRGVRRHMLIPLTIVTLP